MKTVQMTIQVTFDENKTDSESIASALDRLMETATSTPWCARRVQQGQRGGVLPAASLATRRELCCKWSRTASSRPERRPS